MTIAKTRLCLLALSSLSALGALACADASTDPDLAPSAHTEAEPEAAALQVDPSKITIGSVSATGSGCPRGSWEANVSPDGLALTMTFSKYFLEASPSKPVLQSLACTLSLGLDMPRGYSVGVTKVSYQGYAGLEAGMTAEQIANYAWTGIGAVSGTESKNTLRGPYDDSYLLIDNVETRGVGIQWSPCDIRSNLQIRTRLTLDNPRRGSGYINTSDVNIEQGTKLVVSFDRKSC
ncbi:MAG: DUF4360 domain-containing protein [Polyangiales bacterium]